jgi:uncharacterized membrane protein YphA (DoxX/SURF4 family)
LAITAGASLVGWLLLSRLPRCAAPGITRALEWVCRLALAGVFVYAAWEKILDPYAFAANTYAYRLVPPVVATATGIALPMMEVVAAAALVTGVLWRGGALFLGGLLAFFVFALFQAILRGIDIQCGCFGKESHHVSFWLIVQDELLLVAALFLLRMDHLRRSGGGAVAPRR